MTKEEREKAISIFKTSQKCYEHYPCDKDCDGCENAPKEINPTDIKQCIDLALEALEKESCEDAISRADANKLVDELARAIDDQNRHYPKRGRDIAIIARDIERLPRVTPIREHGKWIRVDDTKCKCSKCEITHFIAQYPHGKVDFCPNCGADMRKEQNNV